MTAAPDRWAKVKNGAKFVAGAAVVVALIVFAVLYFTDGSDDAETIGPAFPPGGPVEFLYLDASRVATYLAQVQGGKVDSEKLTRKLTQNLNAKLALKEVGEIGETKASELLAERNLKPTAASSFFALKNSLETNTFEGEKIVQRIHPRYFGKEVKGMAEGTFVEFETSALLSPLYVNAYLSVLHAGTLAAIFPNSPQRRKAAENFFKKVGPTGRAVFAIRPYAELARSGQAGASAVGPKRKPFVYLLPVTVPLLSSERSLLKFGGGSFTVFGLLVRRFPERGKEHRPAYVDSATEETWEPALQRAPGELLCRTAPECAAELRGGGKLSDKDRERVIEHGRQRILHALETQTSIPRQGAVILPIAIYK